ncbi:LapA family protein [Nocardiopsis sp. YSL2]|uniref:LapA family protein n=1 Tax=Nocardiopsis sp. YSL2 TaxID=2939492 RepID=UPI0026F47CDE|nr:LapA family protein [Nocardiopsis sp. YSL2]
MAASTPAGGPVSGNPVSERRFSVSAVPPRLWVALILIVIAVFFVAQNRDATEIQVLFFSLEAPQWAALTATAFVGLLIGLLLRPSERKKRRAAKRK